MTDLLSAPKLPVNISDIAVDAKARIQRMLDAKNSRPSRQWNRSGASRCLPPDGIIVHSPPV